MPVIPRADSREMARRAIVLDLGDLRHQGDQIIAKAQQQAQSILERARSEREAILSKDQDEGFTKGHTQGLEEGKTEGRELGRTEALSEMRERIDAVTNQWEDTATRIESSRDQMIADARRDLLSLALSIAGKVIQRAIEADPTIVQHQLEAAIAHAIRPSRLILECSSSEPNDIQVVLPEIAQRLTNGAHIELVPSDEHSPGSIVLRTEGGEIDASIETQLARIAEAIVPARTPSGDGQYDQAQQT